MRFLLVLSLLLFTTSSTLFAQTRKVKFEQKLETMMREDATSWRASKYSVNSIKITASEESGKITSVSGYFKAYIPSIRSTESIAFKAEITTVLDDYSVNKIWWTQPYLGTYYCVGNCK